MSEALVDEHEVSTETLARAAEVYLALGRIIRSLRRIDGNGVLTAGCASALGTIIHSGPMRLRELAEAEGVTAPTMSRIVSMLESSGHLVRAVDPADARAAVLDVTDAGRELMHGMKSARVRHLATVLGGLPDDQAAVMAAALVTVESELRLRK